MFLIDYNYHYAQNSSEEQPYFERKTENQSIIFLSDLIIDKILWTNNLQYLVLRNMLTKYYIRISGLSKK